MEMPKVKRCDVLDCSYNKENICHAMAITIGDTVHPKCDTFVHGSHKGGDMSCTAGVGACKVETCAYNKDFECTAPGVSIGYKGMEPDCLTFCRR